MKEDNKIRVLCNIYTILQQLTLFHSAYQTHPFANALRSDTINILIARARSVLERRFATILNHLVSIGFATTNATDSCLSTAVWAHSLLIVPHDGP